MSQIEEQLNQNNHSIHTQIISPLANPQNSGYPGIPNVSIGFSPNASLYRIMLNVLDSLKDSSDPAVIKNAIHNLRIMNKFYPDLFVTTFDCVYDIFDKFMFNENPDVVLMTFVFLSELLSQDLFATQTRDWVEFLMPHILEMSANDHEDSSIKLLSLTCLDLLSTKGFYEGTMLALIEGMGHENETYSLNASRALHKFMTSAPDKTYLRMAFDWNSVMAEIIYLYTINDTKRQIAEGILKTLKSIFLEQDLECILASLDYDVLSSLSPLKYIFDFNLANVIYLKKLNNKLKEENPDNYQG
jgi:hypothetical protein